MKNPLLGAATALLIGSMLAGCAFTQWTEHYFFGSGSRKPVYQNRFATGVVILPFALAGDIVTSPIQGLLMVIFGDDFLYKKSNMAYAQAPARASSAALASLDALEQQKVWALADAHLSALDREGGNGPTVFAIGEHGELREVELTPAQREALLARVQPEHVHPRAELASMCRAAEPVAMTASR
jgi:hypothetical protein